MTAALRHLSERSEAESRRRPTTPFADRLFRFNWPLLVLAFVISGIGLFNQYVVGQNTPDDFFAGQALRVGLGFVGFLIVSLIDIRLLRRLALFGAITALGLLIVVAFVGETFNESTRWIKVGSFTLQPSEIAQVALIVFLAAYLDDRTHAQMGNPLWLVPPILMIGAMAFLIFQQPDLGTTIKLLVLCGLMILCSGIRWWLIALTLALIGGAVSVIFVWPDQFLKPYQIERLTCFTSSDAEIERLADASPCDQPRQARIAIGAAGVWGHGPLQAPQLESLIIYEPYNDMILAVHAEQFGLVGTFVLLALVTCLIFLGFGVASVCQAQFTRLLALGAALNFGLYVTINLMMVLSLLPVVGMPFALLSQGGTVTVFTWVSLGLINNAWINRHLVFSAEDSV